MIKPEARADLGEGTQSRHEPFSDQPTSDGFLVTVKANSENSGHSFLPCTSGLIPNPSVCADCTQPHDASSHDEFANREIGHVRSLVLTNSRVKLSLACARYSSLEEPL
jgi:hypothetical protein